eukprot:NODE_237_length_13348_cov_0.297381.p7 type:complete len:123 gc:universal NODE_237_length_13348_cov_0.297381:10457-10825(+)
MISCMGFFAINELRYEYKILCKIGERSNRYTVVALLTSATERTTAACFTRLVGCVATKTLLNYQSSSRNKTCMKLSKLVPKYYLLSPILCRIRISLSWVTAKLLRLLSITSNIIGFWIFPIV